MKKYLILCLLALTVCVTGAFAAEQGYISVSATSQVELVPDTVDFSVEVTATSKDSMTKASEENKKLSGKIYEDLKKLLNQANGDSIKTSNYSANPVYKYTNNKRVLDYYEVKNNIKIHTKNIANVGKMIDTATSDGATSVNNITYSVSQYENETNKLLAESALKAKIQGDCIAKALGTEITGIKSVDSSCSFSGRTTLPRMMLMAKSAGANDAAETSTNIEVGTMTLNSRVNINFYVK
ncbi:MAG: SIMPL domain-containing protein [Cyanobacteria bacterium RUI128]|nr:SIMPL domain-containing protein [Cyanobacteria bacterium RUI128]